MKRVRKILLMEFWIPIVICLVVIVLFENEVLLPGVFGNDKVHDYYAAIFMELITICLIPLSLRLFKFKKVRKMMEGKGVDDLLRWGSVRLCMLVVPMMVNAVLYYLFMNVAFGYMGIIGLLCLVFVYPSKTRCESEVL